MKKTNIIPVNLQEGLIVSEDYSTVLAFYSHHNTIVIWSAPHTEDDYYLPSEIESYEVQQCAHISVSGWDANDDRSAYWFKQKAKNTMAS